MPQSPSGRDDSNISPQAKEPLADHQETRNEALEQRFSLLSAAILQINQTLDLNTVLEKVVECACALTAADRGAIVTVDETGAALDYVSIGFTDEEHQSLVNWPDGPRLFALMRDFTEPLRLGNLANWVRELGIVTDLLPPESAVGMPLRHRGQHVGNYFVSADIGGKEFTQADEGVLTLFASQAAAAIANARTHQAEQVARANLEALIETSPVGVMVMDPSTGVLLSFNREVRRMLEPLRSPGESYEDVIRSITCRLSDGQEFALNQKAMAQALVDATTTHAEEVVASIPDGRHVSGIVNATLIRSGADEAVSLVATIQDLSPIENLERQRAAFLDMVSHELRAPLVSITGSAFTLKRGAKSLDREEMSGFANMIIDQAEHMRGLISDLLDAGRIDSGMLSVSPERTDVVTLVERARSTFTSGGGRHDIVIDLASDLPPVMADQRRIAQVLTNLLANAALHSPDTSAIRIGAARDGNLVAVSVQDEGRGIAAAHLTQVFRKHVRDRKHGLGHGLGLAICKGIVEAHGGRIRAESDGPGKGARFTFTIPIMLEQDRTADHPSARIVEEAAKDSPARILVVDDDPLALRSAREALSEAGHVAILTSDHKRMPTLIEEERPDLVLLDLVLPDADGIELMKSSPELAGLPVIIISAFGQDATIAHALDSGAADYIVKPFSPTELSARVRAALRGAAGSAPFLLGDLAIHYDERRVTVAGNAVDLTATEFDLLQALSRSAGRVMTYKSLLRSVWSNHPQGENGLVRAFVRQLRSKLGDDPSQPVWIFNQRGVGYYIPRPDSP